MELNRLELHDWLMVGAGAAMFVLGLALDWTTIDTGFATASQDGPFDYIWTGGVAFIAVVTVGVLAFVEPTGSLPPEYPWPVIFLGASGLATLLMFLRILMGARFEFADRGLGRWGALLWSLVSLSGAVLNFRAAGGELQDLVHPDTWKSWLGLDDDEDEAPPPPAPPRPPGPPRGPPQPPTS